VVTATDGHQALDVAVRERPEVVLLDVTMPGMDGPETARRLAADPRTAHIPVVLLTAKVMSRERAALADVPVAAVLGKPFDPMTLAVQVAEAVGWAPPVS
jgi:CheY-like chemotaxis protein